MKTKIKPSPIQPAKTPVMTPEMLREATLLEREEERFDFEDDFADGAARYEGTERVRKSK